MKRIVFIIVIISVILYFQYNYINEINNSYEILQYGNPKKNILENVLQNKLISVFTNIKFKWENINNEIVNNLYYYNIPLTIESNHNIMNEPKYTTHLIQKQDKYRRLFYILKGTKRFFIFNNNQQKYLYLKNNSSPINLWNQDLEKYPLIKESKYIEIICRENTMLYIPYNFYYTSISDNDSITIDFYSESIFSKFLKNN